MGVSRNDINIAGVSRDNPFEAPEVMFVGKPPEHEHVYSCGYICLSTLANDWTPALQTS